MAEQVKSFLIKDPTVKPATAGKGTWQSNRARQRRWLRQLEGDLVAGFLTLCQAESTDSENTTAQFAERQFGRVDCVRPQGTQLNQHPFSLFLEARPFWGTRARSHLCKEGLVAHAWPSCRKLLESLRTTVPRVESQDARDGYHIPVPLLGVSGDAAQSHGPSISRCFARLSSPEDGALPPPSPSQTLPQYSAAVRNLSGLYRCNGGWGGGNQQEPVVSRLRRIQMRRDEDGTRQTNTGAEIRLCDLCLPSVFITRRVGRRSTGPGSAH
ncbi:hypothetical protein SKAU_G00316940 [Synaphobranchus kaupii]|uniref:Uncharacterized protein n=1 Tax=Synaphobranchus kaupii TaxID=118154 RepID=A0A9Q1ILY0_SYNKA|nr:hypothetical protein SKAU_G00316940 [Synaphobranchus kaupii]